MRKQLQQLEEFHEVFGVYWKRTPVAALPDDVAAIRVKLLEEELAEYRQAIQSGELVAIADALTDLLYVLLGTYISHGLQDLAEPLFDEVHRSNMSKLDSNGEPVYREDGKVLKSELFTQPDLKAILDQVQKADSSLSIA